MQRIPEPFERLDDPQKAAAHAATAVTAPYEEFVRVFRQTFADEPVAGRVVDWGGGQGELAAAFAKAYPACRVDVVDAAEVMLAHGRRRLPAALADRVTFIHAYVPADPLPGRDYDCVLANSLLHHAPDPLLFWRTLAALGRPDARVCVMDLIRPADAATARGLVDRLAQGLDPLIAADFLASLHAAYTLDEVRAQLRAAGLATLGVAAANPVQFVVAGRLPR